MNKADEIARSVRYDSISAFLMTLRRCASDPRCDNPGVFFDAARAIDCLATEVDCLTAEVERLTDKIDGLKEVTAWNVALSDAEVAALARGVNPARIRPDAIVDPGRIA
jgi:outer membrane murein-binding lipoprotein Lpp